MKTSHSPFAFLLALILHIALLSLLWFVFHRVDKEHPVLHEKRFGVTLTEEVQMRETSIPTPPQKVHSAPSSSPSIQEPPAEAHPGPEKTNALQRVEEIPASPLPRYTEADRDTLPNSVLHHYGDEFFTLSSGEQHYIVDNLQRIRKINEIVGTQLLRERPDDEIDPDDNNVVEFYLNPDGTISDLHLLKNRMGTPLDELTLQTIDLAHTRYPKPDQKTLIRIRVFIIIK